jgi:protein SCO1/2
MYSRRQLLAGLGAAAVGTSTSALCPAAPFTPQAGDSQRIPNVALKTHTGASVRFYDDLIRGKVVAINMMYATCEGICPLMTNNLVRVQALLGKRVGTDVFMYSLSLKPEQDNPRALAEYAEMHEVAPGWLFLTGARADVERVRIALGFYDSDPVRDKDTTRHTGMVRIGNDAYGRWTMAPALAEPRQILSAILRVTR